MINETEKLKNRLIGHLTDEQREIAETLDKPLFVAAGAGSGKTMTLTSRVVWALTPGSGKDGKAYLESIDELLVITFTRAAANEIKERIRTALRSAGLEQEALKVDNAWISTIHGMCSRLLKRHAFSIGIDPEFSFLTESEARYMLDSATEQVCRLAMNEAGYHDLFLKYKYSGQVNGRESSYTLKAMIQKLVLMAVGCRNGMSDIAFVEPQGRGHRYYSELTELSELYDAMLFHTCKDEGEMASLSVAAMELSEFLATYPAAAMTMDLVQDLMDDLFRPDGRKWRAKDVKEKCKEAQLVYDEIHVECEFYQSQTDHDDILYLASQVYDLYTEMKEKENKLDPDDLLIKTQELLEIPEIADLYLDQFKLVMIDEFQDTNRTQIDLISKLSGKNEEHLCTVGDAQQSIYRFNGADVAVFNERKDLMDPASVKTMHKNFRSHNDVLRFVATMCSPDYMIPNFMDLEAGRYEKSGSIYDNFSRVYVEHTHGKAVEHHPRMIADRLARIHREGVPLGDMALLLGTMSHANVFVDELRRRGLSAVITGGSTFTSSPEVHQICPLLHALSNPHDLESGLFPLLTGDMFRLDANDMVLLTTHYDLNADRTNKWPLQMGMLSGEVYQGRKMSPRLINAIKVMNTAWDSLAFEPLSDVLLGVLRGSGWLHRLYKEGVVGQGKLANVFAAIDYITELSQDASLGVARIAHEFDLWLESAREQPAILMGDKLDAIAVTTIHKSKGLEYPVVAVAQINPSSRTPNLVFHHGKDKVYAALKPGGMKSRFANIEFDNSTVAEPTSHTQGYIATSIVEAQAELEEKVRLLYVGLTRARECVILALSEPGRGASSPNILELMNEAFCNDEIERGCRSFDYGGSSLGYLRSADDDTIDMLMRSPYIPVSDLESTHLEGAREIDGEPEDLGYFDIVRYPEYKKGKAVSYEQQRELFSFSSADKSAVDVSDLAASAKVFGELADTHSTDNQGEEEVAVSLGSAFHEAAEYMVSAQKTLSVEEMEHFAKRWSLTRAQGKRLVEALERWSASSIRQKALSWEHLEPEAKFCVKVDTRDGDYIEGAIDLLCYDDLAGEAFVIDYKTGDKGLSVDAIKKRHALQANYYAHILFLQGFTKVTCAFVCVELDGGNNEPFVVEYTFESIEDTKLNV